MSAPSAMQPRGAPGCAPQPGASLSSAYRIAVLRAHTRVMAKQWLPDGTIASYDRAKQFTCAEHEVTDLRHLAALLTGLQADHFACVIRGGFVGEAEAARLMPGIIEREKVQDAQFVLRQGCVLRNGRLFRDRPLAYMMIDVDGFRPLLDPVADPELGCLEFIYSKLPRCFHGCSFFWSLSGSAGHPSCIGLLKVHLWFQLSEPRTSAELRTWSVAVPGIDKSIYNPVQIHYTASPVMHATMQDPVPARSGLWVGTHSETVDLDIPIQAPNFALVSDPAGERTPMADPAEKWGLVGAFCRVFSPSNLAELLPGMFERGRDERHFSWAGADHAPDGVYITSCGHGLVSVHNTAPTGQARRVNVYDFVRLHLFGHMDSQCADESRMRLRPSSKAMREWIVASCPEVLEELRSENSTAEEDFAGLDDAGGVELTSAESAEGAIKELRQLSRDDVARVWVGLAVQLRQDHAYLVVDEVNRLTGIGKRALNNTLKVARAQTKRPADPSSASRRVDARAMIVYRPEDQTEHAREIEAAIVARAKPGEYVSFAGVLSAVEVNVVPFTHGAKDRDQAPPPVPQLVPLDAVAMLAKAEDVVVLHKSTRSGTTPIGIPQQLISILINKRIHAAPVVYGLLAHPIVLPGSGEILQEDGLHSPTGLFLSSPVRLKVVPYSQAQACDARERLRKVALEGFEFATDLDADAALAALMTGVQRRVLDMAPGIAVVAPMQASGKTTLARRIHIILTGHDMPVSSFPEGDETELQKRLLAVLLRSPAMICFDNVTDGTTFRSPSLAAAITGPVFVQRILGGSHEAKCPTNVLMVLTGNNLSLGADEVTRWLTVRLGASTPRPEQRTFDHPDVVAHGLAIRAEVLTDVLGMVAGYRASPALGSKKPLDKFSHSLYLQEWKNKGRSSAP